MMTPTHGIVRGGGRSEKTKRGFTIIELLVVIAIIAILAAIIFPVFNSVRENAREATTMSNLHNISSALALYDLDNRHYPPVLFAYACDSAASAVDGCATTDTMQSIASDPKATNELVGLYPEYIKDWQSFTCPNNTTNTDNAKYQSNITVNTVCPNTSVAACSGIATGAMISTPKAFFLEDAMDISPEVGQVNQFVNNSSPANWVYLPRYQTSWISYPNSAYSGSASYTTLGDSDYIRQLRWINPPADTYVTSVTYHVPNSDRLIVLYQSGSAQVRKVSMPRGWFTGTINSDPGWENAFVDASPTIAVNTTGGESQASFWRYDANK